MEEKPAAKEVLKTSDNHHKIRSLTLEKVFVLFRRYCGVHIAQYREDGYSKEVPIMITDTESSLTVSTAEKLPSSITPTKRSNRNTLDNTIMDLQSLRSWFENETQDPKREDCILEFVKEVYKSIQEKYQSQRYPLYQTHLASAQQMLQQRQHLPSQHLNGKTSLFPRLPSMDDPPLNPVLKKIKESSHNGKSHPKRDFVRPSPSKSSTNASDAVTQIQYLETTGSVKNRKWKFTDDIPHPFMITGTHPPWPKSVSTIYLKSSYAVEDSLIPTHVPYFGDNDKDDVLTPLFDKEVIEEWKQRGLYGPEYKKMENEKVLDQVLELLLQWIQEMIHMLQDDTEIVPIKYNHVSADSDSMDGIIIISDTLENKSSSTSVTEMIMNCLLKHLAIATASEFDKELVNKRYLQMIHAKEVSNDVPEVQVVEMTGDYLEDIHKQPEGIKAAHIAKTTWEYSDKYSSVMDSYRAMFCRRCFSYDCNNHGNVYAPSLDIQTELACRKETSNSWDIDSSWNASNVPDSPLSNELSDIYTLLLKRAYVICQGNSSKISHLFKCNESVIEQRIQEQGLSPTDIMTAKLSCIGEGNHPKKTKNKTSISQYNTATRKRGFSKELRPSFEPCHHGFEPCTEANCCCVKSSFLCTKHCSLGAISKNFYRGCACKAGTCRTMACNCFAFGRECDPDVCLECGTCSDPPNETATRQLCRNDSISMRRHCHLLIAESTVLAAGWGVFTKYDLKKGDFVHEYVGEMISELDGERRGAVHDKLNRSYLLTLCSDLDVDASKKGELCIAFVGVFILCNAGYLTHCPFLIKITKETKQGT